MQTPSSGDGYVLPPRFQQLRAQQERQQQQQQQQPMSHNRSSSFFSFLKPKQPTDQHPSAHERTTSFSAVNSNSNSNSNNNKNLFVPQPESPLPPTPQQKPQQQQQPPVVHPQMSRPSSSPKTAPPTPQLHPEIRSAVHLHASQGRKIYFSGPLLRRVECLPDGTKPLKDDGWTDIWAQLGGTTLSVWDTKEIQQASKLGQEVPPSYINVTDAFVQVLGSVTVVATETDPAKRYPNVFTLNNAGANIYLFSCPDTSALISWAAALRLASWEKTRLDEIYTAHLIRITLSARDVPTTLVKGRMEGWAKIRIAGQTDWKRFWVIVQEGTDDRSQNAGANGATSAPTHLVKKNRMSSLFSSKDTASVHSLSPPKAMITLFTSPKPKDRKKPTLTVSAVTQAFAVYPDRPELISKSTLIKIEGTFGDEEMAQNMQNREGYIMLMPEIESPNGQPAEMLKWIVALHDAFELYGRPAGWTWDPRDLNSLMSGYPVGPQKETLFLERDVAEGIDPREGRTSFVRSEMRKLVQQHMRPAVQVVQNKVSPQMTGDTLVMPQINANGTLPPIPAPEAQQPRPPSIGPQNPPSFGNTATSPSNNASRGPSRPLTPITEKSHSLNHGRPSMEVPAATGPAQVSSQSGSLPQQPFPVEQPQTPGQIPTGDPGPSSSSAVLGRVITHSPPLETSPPKPEPSPSFLASNMANSASLPNTSTGSSTMQSSVLSSQISATTNIPSSPTISQPQPQQLEGKQLAYQGVPQYLASKSPPLTLPGSSSPVPDFQANQARLIQNAKLAQQGTLDIKTPTPMVSPAPSVAQTWNHTPAPEAAVPRPPPATQSPASTSQLPPRLRQALPKDETSDLWLEPATLYFIQQDETATSGLIQKIESKSAVDSEEEEEEENGALSYRASVGPYAGIESSSHSPASYNELDHTAPSGSVPLVKPIDRLSPSRSGLGRKPSGARELNTQRVYKPDNLSSVTVTETEEEGEDTKPEEVKTTKKPQTKMTANLDAADDVNTETIAAYLNLADSDGALSYETKPAGPAISPKPEPVRGRIPTEPTENVPVVRVDVPAGTGEALPYNKSSFAPSTRVLERKAKAKEQQDAKFAAVHRPGRANGRRKSRVAGAWESSEDEEEDEEEDDEEEDVDSDRLLNKGKGSALQSGSSHHGLHSPEVPGRGFPPSQNELVPTPLQLRTPRGLPQIPTSRSPVEDAPPATRRIASENYGDGAKRSYHEEGPQIKVQQDAGGLRRDMWSQVLDPGRPAGRPDQPTRDTFVQLELSETMTKPFTRHGLLSAGIQDKEDRSARRQEELARETGASLINVPNKPPPPQMGLLGYVTAHEREKKRVGGLGAALTEREREKRNVEEHQRRFDEQQRQQLDQMQQGMSMYGNPFGFNPMMNPMMMNMMPMMTGGGMSPMMTGGGMPAINPMMSGFPGMMGGYNPQHMFAAQQAAQAYQQAMVTFSVAGSQVGNEAAGPPPLQQVPNNVPSMASMNPLMTGNMPGYDPRFSMYGMPMMPMGMGSMGGQMPLGAQMTGMSNFDPRASPGVANHSASPNVNDQGLQLPHQPLPLSPGTSSPARGRSPRPPASREQSDPSRPTSPK